MLLTFANLRGLRESGAVFSVPTYAFILMIFTMLAVGLYHYFIGNVVPVDGIERMGEGTQERKQSAFS